MGKRFKMKEEKQALETRVTIENEAAKTSHKADNDGNRLSVLSSVTSGHGTLNPLPHTSRSSSLLQEQDIEFIEEETLVKHEEDKLAYDMFKDRPKLKATTNFCDILETVFLNVSRILMFIILFCMVLVSGVFVKIWMLSLISKLGQISPEDRGPHADRLMVCLIVPWGITFLLSLIKVLFGKTKSLQLKHLVPIVLIDASQAMGVMLMLFIVLPKVDVFRGAVIMMCVGSTPALCVFIKSVHKIKFNINIFLVSLLSLGVQVGCCLALCIEIKGQTKKFPIWALAVSCFLISLGWWENFASGQTNFLKMCSFDKIKSLLKQSRLKSNVYQMSVKILVAVLFIQFYVKNDNYNQVQGLTNVPSTNFTFNSSVNTFSKTNASKPLPEVSMQLQNKTFMMCQINEQINVSETESKLFCSSDTNTVYVCTITNETYTNCMPSNNQPSSDDKIPKFEDDVFGSVYRFYIDNDVVFHVIFFTLLCTYAATLACKLKMQCFAFSLPIVLVPPLTLVVVYINCENIIPMDRFIPSGMMCPKFDIGDLKYTVQDTRYKIQDTRSFI